MAEAVCSRVFRGAVYQSSWPDYSACSVFHVRKNEWPGRPSVTTTTTQVDFEALFCNMDASIEQQREYRRLREIYEPSKSREILDRVLIRDGPECCWCGKQTSREVPPTHPLRSSLEHVVPQSKGGTSSARNCRVACRKCNSERGNADTHTHPLYTLRPRREEPSKPLLLFRTASCTESWAVAGTVEVSMAISRHTWRPDRYAVMVRGDGVQAKRLFEMEEEARAFAQGIEGPVTEGWVDANLFKWSAYMEPPTRREAARLERASKRAVDKSRRTR